MSIAGLALVICAGATIGVGLLVRRVIGTGPCQPPSYEPALIAAYRAEPMLTAGITAAPTQGPAIQPTTGAAQSSDQPDVRHFCDIVGVDHIHPLSYSEVTYHYPASDWRPVPDLLAVYQPSATAEGWVYSGNRNDTVIAAIEFCRTVQGIRSTLTIAMLGHDVTGGGFVEARQIVSVPPDQSCPFQSDLWGPSYFPP